MEKITLALLLVMATMENGHASLTVGRIHTYSCVSVYLPLYRSPFRDCTHRPWTFKERWPTVKVGTQVLPFPGATERVRNEQELIPVISASVDGANPSAEYPGLGALAVALYLVLITLLAVKL